MRRHLRSAAFPLHRHSLPQLAVDGGLVALAYYLAFRLRFDAGLSLKQIAQDLRLPYDAVRERYQRALRQLRSVLGNLT